MTIQDQKNILKNLLVIEKKLIQMFGKTYLQALEIGAVRKAIEEKDATFSFENNPEAMKAFSNKLNMLAEAVDALVLDGVVKSYDEGVEQSIGHIVSGSSETNSEEVDSICRVAINAQRKLGRDARSYANEKRGGFSVSDRVWNIVGNATHEMDILVQDGIMEGKSAAEISRDVRKFLKNPKALFHMVRVKDKDGNWDGTYKLSKAAAAYHPGQGVYRSAYQNALRLARTEVNQGYRVGEWHTYQGNPLIKGYRIKLSSNHTTHDKHTGKYLPLVDICDELQGEYPKEFRWSGWHPNCRCIMVPIIMTPKEFAEYNKAKKEGKEKDYVDKKELKKLPSNFKRWLKDATKRMKKTPQNKWPYFLQDNQWVMESKSAPVPTPKAPAKKKVSKKETVKKTKNELEIEKILGTLKGDVMSFEDANKQQGNVDYSKGKPYHINCQSCVVANELRRRGFDVTAQGNFKGSIPARVSRDTTLPWIDPKTGAKPKKKNCGGWVYEWIRTGKKGRGSLVTIAKELNEATKSVGRYHIDVIWKRANDGHIITLERLENGKVRMYDPQNGERVYWSELAPHISLKYGVNVLKVDELELNPSIVGGVVRKI